MYGKIFECLFSSSINDEALHVRMVFIYMIVTSDRDGVLDITRTALARNANLTIDQVNDAIKILGSPDKNSRSSEQQGRRVIPLYDDRDGWIVVNKPQYREMKDSAAQREQTRKRVAAHRERKRKSDASSIITPNTNTDADAEVTLGNARVTSEALHAGVSPTSSKMISVIDWTPPQELMLELQQDCPSIKANAELAEFCSWWRKRKKKTEDGWCQAFRSRIHDLRRSRDEKKRRPVAAARESAPSSDVTAIINNRKPKPEVRS